MTKAFTKTARYVLMDTLRPCLSKRTYGRICISQQKIVSLPSITADATMMQMVMIARYNLPRNHFIICQLFDGKKSRMQRSEQSILAIIHQWCHITIAITN